MEVAFRVSSIYHGQILWQRSHFAPKPILILGLTIFLPLSSRATSIDVVNTQISPKNHFSSSSSASTSVNVNYKKLMCEESLICLHARCWRCRDDIEIDSRECHKWMKEQLAFIFLHIAGTLFCVLTENSFLIPAWHENSLSCFMGDMDGFSRLLPWRWKIMTCEWKFSGGGLII